MKKVFDDLVHRTSGHISSTTSRRNLYIVPDQGWHKYGDTESRAVHKIYKCSEVFDLSTPLLHVKVGSVIQMTSSRHTDDVKQRNWWMCCASINMLKLLQVGGVNFLRRRLLHDLFSRQDTNRHDQKKWQGISKTQQYLLPTTYCRLGSLWWHMPQNEYEFLIVMVGLGKCS
jgi:hypothetical protein